MPLATGGQAGPGLRSGGKELADHGADGLAGRAEDVFDALDAFDDSLFFFFLLVPQRIDGIELRGFLGGPEAEDDADEEGKNCG